MATTRGSKDFFTQDDSGKAVFDGHDLAELAERFPTPFYVISQKQLRSNFEQFKQAFSHVDGGISVYYSVKSNFESMVLGTLAEMGCGAEISGAMDMELAKRAGMKPDPGGVRRPLQDHRGHRGGSRLGRAPDQHRVADRGARDRSQSRGRRGKKLKVGLRIDPVLSKPYYDKVIATYRKKFGVPIDQAADVGAQINALPNLELVGIMTHIGSQVFHPTRYVHTVEKIFGLIAELKTRGINIEEMNIGGGYPGAEHAQPPPLAPLPHRASCSRSFNRIDVARELDPRVRQADRRQRYNELKRATGLKPQLAIEPGRCIVSQRGAIIGKVLIIKNDWLFTDISINNLPENLFFSEWRTVFPGHRPNEKARAYHISGPTLATQDVHFFEKEVPALSEGSPLAILDTGAYSIARANQFTRARIAVYGIRDNGSYPRRPTRRDRRRGAEDAGLAGRRRRGGSAARERPQGVGLSAPSRFVSSEIGAECRELLGAERRSRVHVRVIDDDLRHRRRRASRPRARDRAESARSGPR